MELNERYRKLIKDKKRIVIKIGSSSLQHKETGDLDYVRMEVLVREICNLRNQGKDVILVTSGSIACGRKAMHMDNKDYSISVKQACAAVGQAKLIMTYEKIFSEYNQVSAQILMNRDTITNDLNRTNCHNTFMELLNMGVVPIVNENDTVATYEISIGDNDTLSAIVAALTNADLLILLSDIDGLYTDNPRSNPDAKFISFVDEVTDEIFNMGTGDTGSGVGTGGMNTKLIAARLATKSGCDMLIANSADIHIIHRIMDGKNYGTFFKANKEKDFSLKDYVVDLHK